MGFFRISCDTLVGGYSSHMGNDCNSFVLGKKYQPFALSNSIRHAYDHFETHPVLIISVRNQSVNEFLK